MSKENKENLDNQNKETEEISEEIKEETEETVEEEKKEEKPKEKKSSKKSGSAKKETKKKEEPKESSEEEKEPEVSPDKAIKEANDKYRKRSQKEREALYGDIKADVVNKFLPVYDNLVRALDQPTEDEAYRKGVEMIMAQFNKTMEGLGVTEISSVGETFDPNLHNAVMHVDDDTKGENEVVEVFQKGFKLGEKVIRFAMVKVAN